MTCVHRSEKCESICFSVAIPCSRGGYINLEKGGSGIARSINAAHGTKSNVTFGIVRFPALPGAVLEHFCVVYIATRNIASGCLFLAVPGQLLCTGEELLADYHYYDDNPNGLAVPCLCGCGGQLVQRPNPATPSTVAGHQGNNTSHGVPYCFLHLTTCHRGGC